MFVVQLLIYGFHELTEANVFPNSEPLHWATEPYGPDGVYGQYLTYLLVALPLGVARSRVSSASAGRRSRLRRRVDRSAVSCGRDARLRDGAVSRPATMSP